MGSWWVHGGCTYPRARLDSGHMIWHLHSWSSANAMILHGISYGIMEILHGSFHGILHQMDLIWHLMCESYMQWQSYNELIEGLMVACVFATFSCGRVNVGSWFMKLNILMMENGILYGILCKSMWYQHLNKGRMMVWFRWQWRHKVWPVRMSSLNHYVFHCFPRIYVFPQSAVLGHRRILTNLIEFSGRHKDLRQNSGTPLRWNPLDSGARKSVFINNGFFQRNRRYHSVCKFRCSWIPVWGCSLLKMFPFGRGSVLMKHFALWWSHQQYSNADTFCNCCRRQYLVPFFTPPLYSSFLHWLLFLFFIWR